MAVSCWSRSALCELFSNAVETPNAVRVESPSMVRSGLRAAGERAQVKRHVRVGAGWCFGTSLCERGYVEEKTQTWLRSRRMPTLALLLAAALLGDPASAKDKTAGTDADRQDASQSEIRLGMSADFSASARALSIELYRGAMAYLLPLNNARSEEHTSELQSLRHLVCRLLLEKKNNITQMHNHLNFIVTRARHTFYVNITRERNAFLLHVKPLYQVSQLDGMRFITHILTPQQT